MTEDKRTNPAATLVTFLLGGSVFAFLSAAVAIEAHWPWLAVGLAAGAAAQLWAITWSTWIVRGDDHG